jgi:Uma2 family endonuclease
MTVANRLEEFTPRPLPLTVADYRILDEAGAFVGRPKVELIEGVLLTVSPQRRWHLRVKSELGQRLGAKLRELGLPLTADVDGTVVLSNDSAPEPDIIVSSAGPPDDYVAAGTVRLLIEVADTTVRFDVEEKKRLYARYGIPEYWVVTKELVHRFWEPLEGSYVHGDERPLGHRIESATIPNLVVESDHLI